MREFYVRISPSLRRRIRVAAACYEVASASEYVRRIIIRWLSCDERERQLQFEPVRGEDNRVLNARFALSDDAHRRIRIIAAQQDVSPAILIYRILHRHVPFEKEAIVRVISSQRTPVGGTNEAKKQV